MKTGYHPEKDVLRLERVRLLDPVARDPRFGNWEIMKTTPFAGGAGSVFAEGPRLLSEERNPAYAQPFWFS